MRVVHLGHHGRSLEILATHQSRLGIFPRAVPSVSSALTEIAHQPDSFTILHIHGLERYNEFLSELTTASSTALKERLAQQKLSVIVQPRYHEIPHQSPDSLDTEGLHHVILSSPHPLAVPKCSYVPHPAEGFRNLEQNDFNNISQLRVLFVPYRPGSERAAAISQTLEQCAARCNKLSITQLETETLNDEESIESALEECEIVVEEFNDHSYGPFAVEAMVRGKAVLSTNPLYATGTAHKMQLCPVIHTTLNTLGERLSRIQEEPRCLRDFAKRSKTFADRHHHVALVAATTVKLYREILEELGAV